MSWVYDGKRELWKTTVNGVDKYYTAHSREIGGGTDFYESRLIGTHDDDGKEMWGDAGSYFMLPNEFTILETEEKKTVEYNKAEKYIIIDKQQTGTTEFGTSWPIIDTNITDEEFNPFRFNPFRWRITRSGVKITVNNFSGENTAAESFKYPYRELKAVDLGGIDSRYVGIECGTAENGQEVLYLFDNSPM